VGSEPGRRTVVGLDLAGAPGRRTGCCVLRGTRAQLSVAYDDDEVLRRARDAHPALVIIDAPLSLPKGRATLNDRSGPHLRVCDRELLRRRIRFFPLTLGPMRMLTERGMRLAREFARDGFAVVEGYPGASQDLLGIPRKNAGIAPLRRGLLRLGLRGDVRKQRVTHDELDAATIAWVGQRYLERRALVIGDPLEGLMVLPRSRGIARRELHPPATK
jgi:uncharacterized protein